MKNYDIKDMVKDGKKVTFSHYQKGYLYYNTECGFEFPVPVEDTGDGRFEKEDRAMLYMRYIRKHIANIKEGFAETAAI
jgi:hypothetical protein